VLFGQDRDALRAFFHRVRAGQRQGRPLEPLEALVAEVIAMHPEYHALLDQPPAAGRAFEPGDGGANPYLHMGLHIALREQLASDRPPGVRAAYRALAARLGAGHETEHAAIECLAECLHEAQRRGAPPDERAYLARLHALAAARPGRG